MTGEFCESFVKTKNFRNPVFGVPGLTVISHNAETERNEDIKNTLEFNFGSCISFFVFLVFVVFSALKHVFYRFHAENFADFILLLRKTNSLYFLITSRIMTVEN